jgi:uroporphyrinogen-III synthase
MPTHIIITRPQHQGTPLCQQCQDMGFTTTHIPSLIITPIRLNKHTITTLQQIDKADIVIITSANAVPAIAPHWPKNKRPKTIIAMGPSTQQAMLDQKLPVDFIPKHYSSEGVLALPPCQQLNDKKVVILSGEGGKDTLIKHMKKQKAQVEKLALYKRECPPPLNDDTIKTLQQNPLLITCTSFDALNHWWQMIPPKYKPWLKKQQLLVINTKMQQDAQKKGFAKKAWLADNATTESITQCIAQHITNKDAPMKTKPHSSPWKPWIALCLAALILLTFFIAYVWQTTDVQHHDHATLTQQIKQQQNQINNLENIAQTLRQQNNHPQHAWQIQQLHDYTHMANAKLTIEQNIPQAIALLHISQDIATELDDDALQQSLTNTIEQLQDLTPPNVDQIHQQYQQAHQLISQLTFSPPAMPTTPHESYSAHPASAEASEAITWQQRLQAQLNKALIIRQNNTPIAPLLPSAQQKTLKENLFLMLANAQWAMHHQHEHLYHESLSLCQTWLTQYAPQNDTTRQLHAMLNALNEHTIAPTMPSLAPLLNQVQTSMTSNTQG